MDLTARVFYVELYRDTFPVNFGERVKELLPKDSEVYGVFHRTSSYVMTAKILVRLANKDVWRKWVLDGFAISPDTTDEQIEILWEDYGGHLLGVAALDQRWDQCPGWAKAERAKCFANGKWCWGRKHPGVKDSDVCKETKFQVETPKRFFRAGKWYSGPKIIKDFLTVQRSGIDNAVKGPDWSCPVKFGQRFL